MDRNGLIALFVGAVLIYLLFHFAFGVELIAFFYSIFLKGIVLAKYYLAKLTLEAIVLFSGTFLKKAALKLPLQALMPWVMGLLTLLLLSPRRRRRIKITVSRCKKAALVKYQSLRDWFDAYFGVNGLLAFVVATIGAVFVFLATLYWFGSGFFLWLGTWGPIGTFFLWCWSWILAVGGVIDGLLRNFLLRFPKVNTFFKHVGLLWQIYVAPRLPRVEFHRKRIVNGSMRRARNSREHSMRVYYRLVRQRKRRKERRRAARHQKYIERKVAEMKRLRDSQKKTQ